MQTVTLSIWFLFTNRNKNHDINFVLPDTKSNLFLLSMWSILHLGLCTIQYMVANL